MSPPVRFYSVDGDFGVFSNFAPYPITIAKKRWPTSEHYFQAQKFLDPRDQERVRSARTPALAAREGRDRRKRLRRDWESVKVSVMRQAVEAKFRQHPELRALLLSTGESELIEHTEADAYWGDAGDGSGRNMLGRILMDIRGLLRSEQTGPA
jgi:ribA/ribD-fused uncharacterized protein